MRLGEAGLQVRDIDLGGFDAESDHKLAEDFVRTPLIDQANAPLPRAKRLW